MASSVVTARYLPPEKVFLKNLSTPEGDLSYEIERLLTFFENMHPKLTAIELATNGYYYDTTEGKIMCFSCKIVVKFSDSSFKHKHPCRYKIDSIPVFLYDEADGENAAAFSVQNTTLETDSVIPKKETLNTDQMLDMQRRLDTFKKWNRSTPVTPTDLAKSGFYYLGYGDAVKCAYCSVQLRNWKENDNVQDEHTRFSSKCPNLESFFKTGLKSELNRIKSFLKWSTDYPLKPNDLAANGFYHKGPADNVCCIFCKCEIKNWKANDNIKEKHRFVSPNCLFLCEDFVDNIPIPNKSDIIFDRPIHPGLALLSERLRTFSSWPKNKKQDPKALAEAGFYHNGNADTVICFSCDGGLRNWEEDDIPWEEHARWFPRCTFVKQMKDSKYISDANVRNRVSSYDPAFSQDGPDYHSLQTDAIGSYHFMEDNRTSDASTSSSPKLKTRKPKASSMETPTVKALLSMGYNRNKVKRIVKNKIKETGSSFSQASDLLDAIENDHFDDNDEEVSDEEEPDQTREKHDTEMSATASADLIAENTMLKEQKLCKICLDEELSVVFLPCGHLVSCASCAPALTNCPLCRKKVHGMVKIFF
ncbi:baculoviral IAP repeat-containing protein 7 [Octopus bimaculoides]|uniref:RING-type domain-containing protein n=1 Tax=Octopus bimaculoides TaxID=37653 RepID=A0A0L8GYB1_OCTBM|nr:baculoviral IAP repeat-containing protein 7 [Octopus bimaculoides]XP_014776965.1 baculoviral IAP repeat-containing protein 7 [Octopus bimaculoides]XP_014776966.1 baculoviral IAP repeat-containing protein 7 [Octopus bimaculoides]XP_052834394.1 baculoviral IAP repeat-containing protein 7 [Octopus bimaculoides]|eukprot:XP_014776964.1 PREDICTED: baculoviral IAP repeat-containing protein 7-like [Octopus bimaculoides]